MRANERAIFEAFVRFVPNFAGRPVDWGNGADPPDVLCHSNGIRIGIELAEWLDQWHIANGKKQEREDDSYRPVLRQAVEIPLRHITEIWMVPSRYLQPSDAAPFARELFAFVRELDACWPQRDDADDPQGCDIEDFSGYSTLTKYLAGLECYGTRRPSPAREWLNMYGVGAAYDPDDAVQALQSVLAKKCAKYETLRSDQQLDELYLLLYYDQGWQYNPPYESPDWGFGDVVRSLRAAAATMHGRFDRIFLFDSVNRRAGEIWPGT